MKPHILVVDDDPDLQALFRMMLARNFELISATSGEQAVALALGAIPDLILLDVMLPDIDGLEVFRQLRADHRTSSIPVILVTARSDILSRVEELKIPVADVIRKPFGPRELLQSINKIMWQPTVAANQT